MTVVGHEYKCETCINSSTCTDGDKGHYLWCQNYQVKPVKRCAVDKGPMSHYDLCRRAEKWLVNSRKCAFALRELNTSAMERPDAIGWREGQSHLIEVKVSRSDFIADAKKIYRRNPKRGMGMYRYMMCPKDIIKPDELPEGWGLLYCLPNSVKIIVNPVAQLEWNEHNEMEMMCSALRRVRENGDLQKIYNCESA